MNGNIRRYAFQHFLLRTAQYRFDLGHCRFVVAANALVTELQHQFFCCYKTHGLLLTKHDGGQPITFHDTIAQTRFSDYRNTRFFQGLYIPVNSTQAHFKAFCQVTGFDHFFGLQLYEYRDDAVKFLKAFVVHVNVADE
ncbi:hypothetical protein D3C72_1547030 [compost metagenome]